MDLFTFRRAGKSFSAEPFLYVSPGAESIILSIGERPKVQVPSVYVHLFKPPPPLAGYSDYLDAFMRHGAGMVASGWSKFVRPQIRISVSRRVRDFMGGYHEGVFLASAMNAGAIKKDYITIVCSP